MPVRPRIGSPSRSSTTGCSRADGDGRFRLGSRLLRWAGETDPLLPLSQRAVAALRDRTNVSAQVYRRQGDSRLCVAAAEPASGLRDGVPVGAVLSMQAGSAAQVLVAWLAPDERRRCLRGAAFTAADLTRTRTRGWAHSVAQREPGVASLSAPIHDAQGDVIAALSISGPVDRLAHPPAAQVTALLDGARSLSASLP